MRRRDREAVVSFIIIIILIFTVQGFNGLIDFIKNMCITFGLIFNMLNQVSIGVTGDTVLVLLFSTTITFGIVGIILEVFNISRGTFGKYFGKLAFWLVGFPVAFVLNFFGRMLFK